MTRSTAGTILVAGIVGAILSTYAMVDPIDPVEVVLNGLFGISVGVVVYIAIKALGRTPLGRTRLWRAGPAWLEEFQARNRRD